MATVVATETETETETEMETAQVMVAAMVMVVGVLPTQRARAPAAGGLPRALAQTRVGMVTVGRQLGQSREVLLVD